MHNTHVGVIGCGEWGQHIVRDLTMIGCEVTVVATSDASRSRAESSGATSLLKSSDQLAGVDGVVVATPTSAHAEAIHSIARLDVPIFCEKPLTASVAEAAALVNTVGDRLFVMDKWRYHPGVEMLRDLSRSGKLGEVLGLRLRRMGWSNPHTDVDASWILLPHDLTIALEILGRVPNITGATGIVTDGAVRAAWIHADVSGVSVASEISVEARHRERSIVVYGTEGTATLADPLADHIELLPLSVPFTDPPTRKQISISMEFPLIRELRSFIDYLNGGIPPKSSAADGAAVVASISRVRELIGLENPSG